jgi:RNA polymerase subunit RPABC4/transcription elongation factor Spt4
MCNYKCLDCFVISDDDTIKNCPVHGKMCPVCGSGDLNAFEDILEME